MRMKAGDFLGNIVISGIIELKTGLHIGGQARGIDIGQTDNPVIKQGNGEGEKVPYIPGSSLKGKIRSLLELAEGKELEIKVKGEKGRHECKREDPCDICVVFGRGAERKEDEGSTRIIFRDAMIDEASLPEADSPQDLTGIKWENTINRVTSKANPRDMEVVPPGAEFPLELTYMIFDEDVDGMELTEEVTLEEVSGNLKERMRLLFEGIRLLEDNYLGGSGTRGYGKVRFKDISLELRLKEYYKGVDSRHKMVEGKNVKQILEALKK